MKSGRVSRREWLWVAGWSAVLLLLTSLPYLLGAFLETWQIAFGGFVIAVEDGNNYLAAMRQGAEGRWSFHNPFTPEAHSPGYIYPFYLLLGKIGRWLGISLPLTFHLAKIVTTPFLLVAVYRFAAHFTTWQMVRRLCLLLVALGGGLGWLWLLLGQPFAPGMMPSDLWVPDASAFLTMLTFPHLALAQALILWIAVSGLQLVEEPSWWRAGVTAGLGLMLSAVHPYSLPLTLGLLGLWWVWQAWRTRRPGWSSLVQLSVIGLVAAPYLMYVYTLFSSNPVFHIWQVQNRIRSPNPLHYVLGSGLIGLLALVALLRPNPLRRWHHHHFLILWVVLVPVGLYIPSNLQRRLLDGYQVPLTLLAISGLLYLLRYVPRAWRWRATTTVVTVTVLSNAVLLMGSTGVVTSRSPLVFQQRQVLTAMDWLATHAPPDSVVLAAYDTGNLLPARALVRTFVGHGPQSVNADEKRVQVAAFFGDDASDEQRVSLLTTYHIDYVFYGPSERALGGFSLGSLPCLHQVYDGGGAQVYQVLLEDDR